jgi:hypothetical protein
MSRDSIVKALHAAGYTTRQVSIRGEHGSLFWSWTATVRDPAVDLAKVAEIMRAAESIRRDERSHEILGGGNTYCHVETTPAVKADLAAPYIQPIKAAIAKLDPEHPTQGIPIDAQYTPEGIQPCLWYMYQRPGNWLEITYNYKRISLYADRPEDGAAALGEAIKYPDLVPV